MRISGSIRSIYHSGDAVLLIAAVSSLDNGGNLLCGHRMRVFAEYRGQIGADHVQDALDNLVRSSSSPDSFLHIPMDAGVLRGYCPDCVFHCHPRRAAYLPEDGHFHQSLNYCRQVAKRRPAKQV